MALTAAAQMCSGVGKSGSPRLKSKTVLPWARSCRASAPAASVADGCTSAAMGEVVTALCPLDIPYLLSAVGGRLSALGVRLLTGEGVAGTPNSGREPRADSRIV